MIKGNTMAQGRGLCSSWRGEYDCVFFDHACACTPVMLAVSALNAGGNAVPPPQRSSQSHYKNS
jgi:hypothetical protein